MRLGSSCSLRTIGGQTRQRLQAQTRQRLQRQAHCLPFLFFLTFQSFEWPCQQRRGMKIKNCRRPSSYARRFTFQRHPSSNHRILLLEAALSTFLSPPLALLVICLLPPTPDTRMGFKALSTFLSPPLALLVSCLLPPVVPLGAMVEKELLGLPQGRQQLLLCQYHRQHLHRYPIRGRDTRKGRAKRGIGGVSNICVTCLEQLVYHTLAILF